MSRSGYEHDGGNWEAICWRGAVASSIRGKRGQQFLSELLAALDDMPVKRLIATELEENGEFCALGVIGEKRGIELNKIAPEDAWAVSNKFDIAEALAREIVYMNDEAGPYLGSETSEARWVRMRQWVFNQIVLPIDEGKGV